MKSIPLDEVIPDSERVLLIKIDVQGWEYHVLKGAKRILSRKGTEAPYLIYEEDEKLLKASNSSSREIREFLHSVGYHHCTQHGTDAHCTKTGWISFAMHAQRTKNLHSRSFLMKKIWGVVCLLIWQSNIVRGPSLLKSHFHLNCLDEACSRHFIVYGSSYCLQKKLPLGSAFWSDNRVWGIKLFQTFFRLSHSMFLVPDILIVASSVCCLSLVVSWSCCRW